MNVSTERQILFDRAVESLAGAESELANGRYNNRANRCCYCCFQAAIVAPLGAGIRPPGGRAEWSHAFVQAQFVEQLIDRRNVYPASMRDLLLTPALLRESRRAPGSDPNSAFDGDDGAVHLSTQRSVSRTILLRQTADYRTEHVTRVQAFRAVRRTREFLDAVQTAGGGIQ